MMCLCADHKWGSAYLTREFFHRLGDSMADHVVLATAQEHGSQHLMAGEANGMSQDLESSTPPVPKCPKPCSASPPMPPYTGVRCMCGETAAAALQTGLSGFSHQTVPWQGR